MPSFRYSALSAAGELVQGRMDAPTSAAVIASLHASSLIPIDAEEGPGTEQAARAPSWAWRRTLRPQELAMVGQQLGRLLKAGVPVDRALRLLVSLAGREFVAESLRGTLDRLTAGATLADAMDGANGAFPAIFVSMVRAGEVGGALQPVLVRTSDFMARSEAMRQKVLSALIYPVILLVVSSGAILLVMTVVLPQFQPLFEDAGASLPSSTRLVMAISQVIRDEGWLSLPAAVVLGVTWRLSLSSPAIRLWRDRRALSLPLFGTIVTKLNVARFTRMLGTLLGNGVDAPRALAMSGEVVRNRHLADAIEAVAIRFREGEGLSDPLAQTGLFPNLATQLIRIGEETGRLDEMLHEVADIYDQEVQRALDRLLALLVPAMTVFMGLIIAGVVVSILVAMISINNLAG